jgi:hypothetical protein
MQDEIFTHKLTAIKFIGHVLRRPGDYFEFMRIIWEAQDMQKALIKIVAEFSGGETQTLREFQQKDRISSLLFDLLNSSSEEIEEALRKVFRDFVKSYPDVIGQWEMEKEAMCKKVVNCK